MTRPSQPSQPSQPSPGRQRLGGVVHTYQKYDPRELPGPRQAPPDLLSPAFDHMLMFGNRRQLTPEELARAVRIDPSEIAGFGPSIEALLALLLERKRKILAKYETDTVQSKARSRLHGAMAQARPPKDIAARIRDAVHEEQLFDLEEVWYIADRLDRRLARRLLPVLERLREKYQVDELAADYDFTGRTPMSVEQALEIKAELEKIDELIKQLMEARETAQIGVVDLEALAEYAEPGDLEHLQQLQQMVEDYVREMAARQGLEHRGGAFQLTPQAYRLFQGRLLEKIFSNLEPSRTGRHQGPVVGEGSVEMQRTKPYEFGDSVSHMDIPQSLINTMLRQGDERPLRMAPEDIVIHRTRNTPKCATVVIMDMSGSMRYEGQYINVKRMALALQGLIRSEYPGDFVSFLEMATFARRVPPGEIIDLMPKPVTMFDPVVRKYVDMSRDDISEHMIPPHFTNIQHALQMSRRLLAAQDTPNRQVILITDGLPTAHFEGHKLHLLYPPCSSTEQATLREGVLCQQENVTINIFLVPSWSQSEEDIRFAYRLAEGATGRVFFTAGNDLDRYVVWDYVNRRREVVA